MNFFKWFVCAFASVLWVVFSLFFLSFVFSLRSENQSLVYFKTYALITIVIMFANGIYMYLTSLKLRRWLIYRVMRISLINLLLKSKYQTPLYFFAEVNKVNLSFAQRYIDSILHHFNGRMDIDVDGIIRYENIYKQNRKR